MWVLATLCLAVASAVAAPKSTPADWKLCKRTDPKLDVCLQEAITTAVIKLSLKGSRELGVFPVDPLLIQQLDLDQGNGPVSIELHFKDLNIHGFKDAIVSGPVKSDVAKGFFDVPVRIAEGLSLEGHYKINGKVLVLPIRGEGNCELKLDNVTANIVLHGKEVTKDRIKYNEVTDFKFTFDTTRLRMRFDDLFNGQKDLSAQMNSFLNENWSEILHELKPSIQDAFGYAFRDVSNRIFLKIPYDKLFS